MAMTPRTPRTIAGIQRVRSFEVAGAQSADQPSDRKSEQDQEVDPAPIEVVLPEPEDRPGQIVKRALDVERRPDVSVGHVRGLVEGIALEAGEEGHDVCD